MDVIRHVKSLTVIILFLLYTATYAQQTAGNLQGPPPAKIPDNETGRIIREFINAVNSSDEKTILSFTDKYFSGELSNVGKDVWDKAKYREMMLNLSSQAKKIEPADVISGSSPDYLGVVFQSAAAGRLVSIEFYKNAANNSLRYLEVHPMQMPKGPYKWPEGISEDTAIASAIEKRILKETADDQFSGTVLIARKDRIIYKKAFGYSNKEKKETNTQDTRFHTGSIGKMITAAAIGQLVEKGKLNFTDTLGNILRDYPNKDAAANVTIHNLLTHTSGIADPFELGRRKSGEDYSTAGKNFPLFADAPLSMKPGAYHSYSNGNYAVLAAIVEKVSGESFEEYLRKNIFIPSGMEIADPSSYSRHPRAVSYTFRPEKDPLGLNERTPANKLDSTPEYEYSGYSILYLTADDIYKFLHAFKEGKIVSRSMAEALTSGKVAVQQGAPIKYGYGFYDANMWGVNMRGHSGGGGNSGIGADAEMVWDKDYYVIVLGNYDLDVVRPLTFSIVRFLGSLKQ